MRPRLIPALNLPWSLRAWPLRVCAEPQAVISPPRRSPACNYILRTRQSAHVSLRPTALHVFRPITHPPCCIALVRCAFFRRCLVPFCVRLRRRLLALNIERQNLAASDKKSPASTAWDHDRQVRTRNETHTREFRRDILYGVGDDVCPLPSPLAVLFESLV